MRYDLYVSEANGAIRLMAHAIPEADAKQMLWVAVRENTLEADKTHTWFAGRVEVRETSQ